MDTMNMMNGTQAQQENFRSDAGRAYQEGNVVRPVTLMTGNDGRPYGYLRLAVACGYTTDAATGQKVQKTEFWDFSCNGNVALIASTLAKGTKVRVDFSVNVTAGQDTGNVDQAGNKIYSPEKITLRASKICVVLFPPKAQDQAPQIAPAAQVAPAPQTAPAQQQWQAPQPPVAPQMAPAAQAASAPVAQMPATAAPAQQQWQAPQPPVTAAPQAAPAAQPQVAPQPAPQFAGNFAGGQALPFGA